MSRSVQQDASAISRAALMASLRPDGGGFAQLVEEHAGRIDWHWVVERAAAHKVAALLAARVEQSGVAACVEARSAARLRKIREEASHRAEVAARALQRLARDFGSEGIPFVLIKGSVLAEQVYRDPTLRRFHDIDIVVPPEAVEHAEDLLRSAGYQLGQVERLLARRPRGQAEVDLAQAVTRRFYRQFEYELPFTPPAGDTCLPVDLHWHIAPHGRLKASARQLWEQTVLVVVAETSILTFNPEATLIHLAIHATTCAFAGFRLLHLCDVAWAATRFGDQFRGLWELADAWGVRAHLDAVLEMTERALGVARPAALRPARPRQSWPRSFHLVANDAFLVDGGGGAKQGRVRRAWMEVVWSVAMHCLRHNVVRSIRVRLSRLRWQVARRRLPTVTSGETK